ATLGPDPLRADADPQQFIAELGRRRGPIGAVLLDQRVIAGVGNVFRAEALFAAGLHPARAADSLTRVEADRLWAMISAMLADGLRHGRIVTVDPRDVGASDVEGVPDDDRMLVYKRGDLPCRRCGAPIASRQLGGRTIWLCPGCQQG
ncbi:MAG TPA: zinc finger domain-containing protein, partial [Egibacteraceae bacterium]|nr:zinc finger domain-containing protein [Egibacteraceae bacterium]